MSARSPLLILAFVAVATVNFVPPAVAQNSPATTIDPAATAPRPGQRPELSDEQRTMIFQMVRKDGSKLARADFPAQVGAEVPPALELHNVPDDALIQVPVAKMYKCVVVDGKVVLVDPTIMRVVEVIER